MCMWPFACFIMLPIIERNLGPTLSYLWFWITFHPFKYRILVFFIISSWDYSLIDFVPSKSLICFLVICRSGVRHTNVLLREPVFRTFSINFFTYGFPVYISKQDFPLFPINWSTYLLTAKTLWSWNCMCILSLQVILLKVMMLRILKLEFYARGIYIH